MPTPATEPTRSEHASPESVLEAERTHLAQAREDLHRMREHVLSLNAQGGNAVSTEYLKAALYRRAKSLEDDPDLPLFFGRIDRVEPDRDTFHIGRRHVMDRNGDPVVIDWRADVSRAFYQATRTDPHGVTLRRRYGYSGGAITSYEDEHLRDPHESDHTSRILTEEIERPRVGPMRDIVATIQPEQDDVVRATLATTVCVQGAPGTGKTAVGLHRAAYLLHTFRDRLERTGVLVVGPNDAFLHYIGHVLPTLGEVDVRQATVAKLVESVPVKAGGGTTEPATTEAATIKGDARMADVLRRAVWNHIGTPTSESPGDLYVPRGTRRWRVPVHEVQAAIDALRERGDGYATSRVLLPQRLAHRILLRMEASGMITDDRDQNAVARAKPMKDYVNTLWPALDPVKLVLRLLGDAHFLSAAADGILTDDEQEAIRWSKPARGVKSAPWTHADAVLVDEARSLLERFSAVGHVVLDEAQDLSPMELRAVGRRAGTGSLTILGDIAQGTTPWATPSWEAALEHLGRDNAQLEVLRKGYRVPAAVVQFTSGLLPSIAPGIAPPEPVRTNPGHLDVVPVKSVTGSSAVETLRAVTSREGSVGVITPDALADTMHTLLTEAGIIDGDLPSGGHDPADSTDSTDEPRVTVVPATIAKGLEYDHVVVIEPSAIVAAEPRGLRRLYVVLTRAVSTLTVLHVEPLPPALLH